MNLYMRQIFGWLFHTVRTMASIAAAWVFLGGLITTSLAISLFGLVLRNDAAFEYDPTDFIPWMIGGTLEVLMAFVGLWIFWRTLLAAKKFGMTSKPYISALRKLAVVMLFGLVVPTMIEWDERFYVTHYLQTDYQSYRRKLDQFENERKYCTPVVDWSVDDPCEAKPLRPHQLEIVRILTKLSTRILLAPGAGILDLVMVPSFIICRHTVSKGFCADIFPYWAKTK